MRRTLTVLLALTLSGCSIAAAAAGTSAQTVQDAAELDGLVIGSLLSAVASAAASEAHLRRDDRPAYNAFLCYLNADGGEEVRADTRDAAEQICLDRHGRGFVPIHCACERVAEN